MELQPLVSIVMPAYNCEKFIEEAVASVEAQTYKNWELIIVEDKSTDHTWEIANGFENEKIRIYQNEKNCGVAKTRNRGVALARGNWIAFLDSDDIWRKDKLEKQIAFLSQKKEARLIFTASAFMDENGKMKSYILHVPDRITRKQLLKQNLISCSSVLVKRELLRRYPFPERKVIHEDFVVWLQVLADGSFANGIDEPLLTYRLSETSKSGNKIKAAAMNWNAYRFVGLTPIIALYYMVWYALNGIKKYKMLSA